MGRRMAASHYQKKPNPLFSALNAAAMYSRYGHIPEHTFEERVLLVAVEPVTHAGETSPLKVDVNLSGQ